MSGIIRKKESGEAWETVEDTGGGGAPSGAAGGFLTGTYPNPGAPSQWTVDGFGGLTIDQDTTGGDVARSLIIEEPAASDDWTPFQIANRAGPGAFYFQLTKSTFNFDQPDGTPIISASAGAITLGPDSAPFHIRAGTADPSAGGGVAENAPAIYVRNNSGATELWLKTSAPDTGWQQITVP